MKHHCRPESSMRPQSWATKSSLFTSLATGAGRHLRAGQGFQPKHTSMSLPRSLGFLTTWQLPRSGIPRKSQAEVTSPPVSCRMTSVVRGWGQSYRAFWAQWKCLHECSGHTVSGGGAHRTQACPDLFIHYCRLLAHMGSQREPATGPQWKV